MTRSFVSALLCLLLLGAVQLTNPRGRGLIGAGDETQIWILLSVWASALGLLVCAGLCVLSGRRRSIHPMLPLAFPLAGLVLAAVGWVVKAGEVGVFEEETISGYDTRLLSLGRQAWHAIEVPAVGLHWAGAAFIGAVLVAACFKPDDGDEAKPERARWIWPTLGFLTFAGAAAAAVIIAGSTVTVSHSLDGDIQPWTPSFEPLYHFRGLPLQLSLFAMLLLPAMLASLGLDRASIKEESSRRLASARTLASAALIGAIASLSLAGPVWIAALRQEAMALAIYEPPYVWLGHPTDVSNEDWGSLLLVTRILLISSASIISLAIMLRPPGSLVSRLAPTATVALALGAVLLSGSIAAARTEAGAGGPCDEECTCRQVVVARALMRDAPTREQMSSCELWYDCVPPYVVTGGNESSDLRFPQISASDCPIPATQIAVTRNAILVDGRRVLDLRDGRPDPSNMRDGAKGYFVNPLFDALTESAHNQKLIAIRNPQIEFRGEAVMLADRGALARTIDDVIYTAKMAEYLSLSFMVKTPDVTDRSPFRVVRVEAGRIVKTLAEDRQYIAASDGSTRGRCHELLLMESNPIDGICAGTYEADNSHRVAVARENRCSAPPSELVAEIWRLSLTEEMLELRSPRGDELNAESARSLADSLRGQLKGRAAVRLLALDRADDLPYAEELKARAALISPDLFAAAVLAGHMMPDMSAPIRADNPLSSLMGNQIGESFGHGALDTVGPGRRVKTPRIRTGTAAVRGHLTKEVIRREIRRNINPIRTCYETEWERDHTLRGRVQIRFVITPSGAVSSSTVASSTLGNPAAEQCIAREIADITFPEPEGGGVVIVTYPFGFEPVH